MGMHDFHEGLPAYNPEAIFHDGCAECERRGELQFAQQLGHLDNPRFLQALERSRDRNVSVDWAEYRLLQDLAVMQDRLRSAGFLLVRVGEPVPAFEERS